MNKDRNYLKQLCKETKAQKTPSMSYKQVNDLITGKMIYGYINGELCLKYKAIEYEGYLRRNFSRICGKPKKKHPYNESFLTHNLAKKLAIYGQITKKAFAGYYCTIILK